MSMRLRPQRSAIDDMEMSRPAMTSEYASMIQSCCEAVGCRSADICGIATLRIVMSVVTASRENVSVIRPSHRRAGSYEPTMCGSARISLRVGAAVSLMRRDPRRECRGRVLR